MSQPADEPVGARQKWNRRYLERGFRAFADAPAEWLSENRCALQGAPGRRALDLACGDGRNAVYLAQLGFGVVTYSRRSPEPSLPVGSSSPRR